MLKRTILISLSLFLCCNMATAQKKTPLYLDDTQPLEDRVEDALARMTTEEKVALIHAQSKFSSPGVPRLGIPENWMSDGPHGIRAEVMWDEWYGANWTNDSCIAFPALTCLAASWDPALSKAYGVAIGEEARYRNKNVLLGPGVNIYRTPLNGRNFEYMGEDPFLASKMVVPYIHGVQQNGVAACVKHFAVNNQEEHRHGIDVVVSDRALHEIYLPAFKAAVHEGKAWAIMGAYNKYKGQYCCHNEFLLNDILKKDWGFDGVVVSDWGGTHDTNQAIKNGLDMEFGSWTDGLSWGASNAYDNYYLANPYLDLLKKGKVTDNELNDKVRRVLRLSFRTTMNKNRPWGSFGTEEHALVGRTIAQAGIVLLKNEKQTLPIDLNQHKKILVVGENATKSMTIGGGSSSLKVKYEVSPLEGIQHFVGNRGSVKFVEGYRSPAVREQDVEGAVDPESEFIDYVQLRQEAVEAARQADFVVFVGGLNKNPGQDCEGGDRSTMDLSYEQDALIDALVQANTNLAIVMISGNAYTMPWVKRVPAILQAWYGGTEAGNALAPILFGEVNPSGKLPFTFPAKLTDNGAHAIGEYPGENGRVEYKDDIFVGYRWTEKEKIKPLFAFGHGLSYTTFEYGKVHLTNNSMDIEGSLTASVTVKNTGSREGAEIVQLYIGEKKPKVSRPLKELKGFEKIHLQPNEEQTIFFTIDKNLLSFYDEEKQQWSVEPGKFELFIGAASDNILTKTSFTVKK